MFELKAAGRTLPLLLALTFLLAGPALAKDGQGYLGVSLQDLTPSMTKALQLGDRQGVLVNEIMDDSPAKEAGFENGDVILEFDGRAIEDNAGLTKAVRKTAPGDKIDVLVLRDGKEKTLAVTMGENEGSTWFQMDGKEFDLKALEGLKNFHMFSGAGEDRGFLGIHMEDLNPQLGDYFGVKEGEGVLLTEVIADGPSAKAGLKAGDVIVKIGDERIASTSDLHEAMDGTKPDQELKVSVKREGKDKSFKVTLGEAPESEFVRGPRMKMMLDGENGHQMMIRRANPDGEFEIKRMAPGSEDLDQVREELEQLRQELEQLRQEMKKTE